MRLAFFGGTFDPIHRGHLAIASAAADAFKLDRVLFAPVGRQPLKAKRAIASFADRVEMVRLAVKDRAATEPRFAVSTVDAPRPDDSPNYTIDTLAKLSAEFPGAQLFVLTGADSFLTMRSWRASDELLQTAEWIVVSRPEFPLTNIEFADLRLTPAQRERIHLLQDVHIDISATELRSRLAAGLPCGDLLSPSVEDYIRARHLYQPA